MNFLKDIAKEIGNDYASLVSDGVSAGGVFHVQTAKTSATLEDGAENCAESYAQAEAEVEAELQNAAAAEPDATAEAAEFEALEAQVQAEVHLQNAAEVKLAPLHRAEQRLTNRPSARSKLLQRRDTDAHP